MDSATSSSPSGCGVSLSKEILFNLSAPPPTLPPPLQPLRSHHQQLGATPESSSGRPLSYYRMMFENISSGRHIPKDPDSAIQNTLGQPPPLPRMRFENVTSDRPVPKDPESVTMDKIIDQYLLPSYFARNPTGPHSRRVVKRQYITQMRDRHAKLTARVENWRQKVTLEEDQELAGKRLGMGFDEEGLYILGRKSHQASLSWRHASDRLNLTDFVNGRVEGLQKGRLMCWPVLISARGFKVWFHAGQAGGEQAVPELQRTESVERLGSLRI
ncbi:MAG: hypothetical protein LQ338_003302 [Usnochroma carphineum]|nr:MAG: hypothetical protein LQ338_003302 [Usnochroma carphineum]